MPDTRSDCAYLLRGWLEDCAETSPGTWRFRLVEAFYFTFGKEDGIAIVDLPDHASKEDGIAIVDLPDHASAVAIPLIVRATGTADMTVVPLLTPEEVDAATKKTINYRPPGQ